MCTIPRLWSTSKIFTSKFKYLFSYFQDSQEFIRCFLDVLHNELKTPIEDKPLPSPSSLSSTSGDDVNSEGVDSGMSTENVMKLLKLLILIDMFRNRLSMQKRNHQKMLSRKRTTKKKQIVRQLKTVF